MRTELLMRNAIWRLRCAGSAVAMLRGSAIRVTNNSTVSTNPAMWAGVMDAMSVMCMSDPDEPCFWFCIDALQHPCVIVRAFDVVAIDPEVESVTICLHVSIALAVFDNGAGRKTVKRGGERAEDNGRVDRHRVFTPFFDQSCAVCVYARVPLQGLEPWTHGLKVRCSTN